MGKDTVVYEADLLRLQQEVAEMENQTLDAIVKLESHLNGLAEVLPETEIWASCLDSIEIFTMEEMPPLKESIRQIHPALI